MSDYRDSVFITATVLGGTRVAGVRVRPFSCWHASALYLFDSPFLTGAREPDAADLIVATLVCRDRYADGLRSVRRFQRNPLAKLAWSLRLLGRYQPARGILEMQEHIQRSVRSPEMWSAKDGSGKGSAIPWPFKVATSAARHYRMTLAEAFDLPASMALCLCASVAEDNGADLVDEYEMQRAREVIEEAARKAAATTDG